MQGVHIENAGKTQLKIESKKLHSGKCQVKFYLTGRRNQKLYGYTLVDSKRSLKEVITELKEKLENIGGYENFYQNNLFSIKRKNNRQLKDILIFKN